MLNPDIYTTDGNTAFFTLVERLSENDFTNAFVAAYKVRCGTAT